MNAWESFLRCGLPILVDPEAELRAQDAELRAQDAEIEELRRRAKRLGVREKSTSRPMSKEEVRSYFHSRGLEVPGESGPECYGQGPHRMGRR